MDDLRTDRRPFHLTIVDALTTATQERNEVSEGIRILALTRLLNATEVPFEAMLPLAEALDALGTKTAYRPPLRDSANRIRALHRRLAAGQAVATPGS